MINHNRLKDGRVEQMDDWNRAQRLIPTQIDCVVFLFIYLFPAPSSHRKKGWDNSNAAAVDWIETFLSLFNRNQLMAVEWLYVCGNGKEHSSVG